jgi:hypothetical protein
MTLAFLYFYGKIKLYARHNSSTKPDLIPINHLAGLYSQRDLIKESGFDKFE